MVTNFLKRSIDLSLAIFLILFLSPLWLVVAAAIKINSQGPIFVEISDRVGRLGRPFRMYKFRTMVRDAHEKIKNDPEYKKLVEEWKRNSFKLNDDPRITSVGKWLRRFSLDEFPQLINVIKGEMSLVGPRALYPEEFEMQKKNYSDLSDLFDEIIKVRPGASGVWQVSGRSDLSFRDRINIDSSYAKNPSLLTYLKVIAKTPFAILFGRGAQ